MAILSNINGKFAVDSTGAIQLSGSAGTANYVLVSGGAAAAPTWVAASTVIGGPYLPLSGGTLTGATATSTGISFTVGGVLTGTSAIFTNALNNTNSVNIINTGGTGTSYGLEIKAGTNATDHALQVLDKAGGNLMRVTGAGNVGIGTASPGYKLNVINNNTATWTARFTNNTNNVYLSVNDANNYGIYVSGETKNYFSGNVGIGTISPSQKLNVRDDGGSDIFRGIEVHNNNTSLARAGISFQCYDWVQSAIWHGRSSTAAYGGALVLGTNPNTSDLSVSGVTGRMWILNSGNVGIGTASPGYKLDVSGGGIKLDGKCELTNNAYFIASATSGFRWNSSTDAYNNCIMYDNGNMYVRGNVGIGTTTPTSSGSGSGLDVSGMVVVRGTLASHQTNAGVLERNGDKIALRAYGATAGSGYLAFNTGGGGGSADTERMRIDQNGDISMTEGLAVQKMLTVGTNQTSGRSLLTIRNYDASLVNAGDLLSELLFTGRYYSGSTSQLTTAGINLIKENADGYGYGGALAFDTGGGAEAMRITSGGNVGIGTTSPGAKLEIQGSTSSYHFKTLGGTGNSSFGVYEPTGGELRLYMKNSAGSIVNSLDTNGDSYLTGGNVGIGVTAPVARVDAKSTYDYNVTDNGVKAGRVQYSWYTGQVFSNTDAYVHIKTNLWMGGSPAGNTSYIMGGFTAKGYTYAGSYGEGSCMFHNWSGSFHGLSVTNRGSWATFMQNPYVSTDGYCVIVLRHNYYSTPAIDWCQYYTGYPWREIAVTVTSTSANATGVY